jgi:hypothetical protein
LAKAGFIPERGCRRDLHRVGRRRVCVDDGTFDDSVDAVYGIGQYHFSDRWGGRIEWNAIATSATTWTSYRSA